MEEQCNQVFKRFWRSEAAAAQEGVGLGLYLAQEIATRQRGYISVKSVAGEGAVVAFHRQLNLPHLRPGPDCIQRLRDRVIQACALYMQGKSS